MFNTLLGIFTANWYWVLLVAVLAYLIGSINPAVIVTKVVTKGKSDIRQMGSGNAGFTNVLRSVGKVPAIITIVCDALKCIAAVFIGYYVIKLFVVSNLPVKDEWFVRCFLNCAKYNAGVFCIVGHAFPLYFRFKGGKGIVTAAALILAVDWRAFLIILGTFLIVFLISRIISLGSIIGSIIYGPAVFFTTFVFDHLMTAPCLWYVLIATVCGCIIGGFALAMHRENIKRLIRGEEKKIHAAKKAP